ncbi:retinol dehydrogenase 7-like [Ornithodoros turicata]|uniref:retinol dehydrogenase 7-like n=1 Tax=Ornithodoros turicata TaxID=34597 RepID=UPI00313A21BE
MNRRLHSMGWELAAYTAGPWLILGSIIYFLPALWGLLSYVTGALGLALLATIMGRFISARLPNARVQPEGRAVLITGCDTGFGHDLSVRLDKQGFQVFAGCLFPDGEGAKSLRRNCSSRLHVVTLDVTKEEHFESTLAYVKKNLGDNRLWAVVANAGIFLSMELEWMPMKDIRKLFEVNVFGCVRTVQTFLPLLRESKGRVVLMASYAGRGTSTWINAYSMTKHAVISLGDGLRRELAKWDVTVSMVEPTYHKTPIIPTPADIIKKCEQIPEDITKDYGKSYMYAMAERSRFVFDTFARDNVSEVVDTMETATCIKHPQASYKCIGYTMWVCMYLLTVMPTIFGDVTDYLIYTPNVYEKNGRLVESVPFYNKICEKLSNIKNIARRSAA